MAPVAEPAPASQLKSCAYDSAPVTEIKGQKLKKCSMVMGELASGKTMKICCDPGWSWSGCIKPIVGGELCQATHMGYVLKGSMTCVLADGTKMDLKAGESYSIPAGHDAWTEEGCEVVEFAGAWK